MKFADLTPRVMSSIRKGHAVELTSAPGRGKSTWVRWLRDYMTSYYNEEIGFAELFLATQAPPDLVGYLFKGSVTFQGKEYSITDPTLPTWFMCEDGQPCIAYKHGLLILDEYGKGAPDVKAASAELLLHGRIGSHRLPDGFGRIALSNRFGVDRSGETKQFDFVINRRGEVAVDDDLAGTIAWMEEHGAPRQLLAWAQTAYDGKSGQPIIFESPPEKQGPWCTPRSAFMAGEWLLDQATEAGNPDRLPYDPLTVEYVQGYIGVPAAQSLFAALMIDREQPAFDEIVRDPLGVRVPERADACMMVAYNLAHKVDPKTIKPVIAYIDRFGKDFAVTFAKVMLKKSPKLATEPTFLDWSMKNGTLIAQISALKTM